MTRGTRTYSKPPLTPSQHIALLEERGLTVPDHDRAKRYIRNIGYQRLKYYCFPFHSSRNIFKPGIEFGDLLHLYIFDRKLRGHILDAIERIEVAVRSVMSGVLSETYGSHWYTDQSVFTEDFTTCTLRQPQSKFEQFLVEVERQTGKNNHYRRDPACKHYYDEYCDPDLPPSWVVIEVLSMGTWSRLYENLTDTKTKKKISQHFGFLSQDFAGWIHALTLIRNTCAHHARIWNRVFTPRAAKINKYAKHIVDPNSAYCSLVLIQVFLETITNNSRWAGGLRQLLDEWNANLPIDLYNEMKFPTNWYDLDLWKLS